jgi:RNA polymerase sigma-70 factor (ECF subfamily)
MNRVAPKLSLAAHRNVSGVAVESGCLAAYQKEFDYLCRALRRLGVPNADIEDLVHEVFLVLHRRWDAYDPRFPVRPWLFGIAFRVVAAHRKRRAREVPQAFLEVEDVGPQPDEVLAAHQARSLALAALERVPLPRRAVLIMHDIDHVAMHEIGVALSIPLFTAYSRLRKARKEFEAAVRTLHALSPQR